MHKNPFNLIFSGVLFLGVLFLVHSCKVSSELISLTQVEQFQRIQKRSLGANRNCSSQEGYTPSLKYPDHIPMKIIRVNFHYMNNSDSTVNFRLDRAKKYTKDLLFYCHEKLEKNKRVNLPLGHNMPVLPFRYRYELTASEGYESNNGVYVHNDDDLYYFLFKGKNQNLGKRTVYEKYAIGEDSILNIFMQPHHPDSVGTPTYGKGGSKGVALGSFVKISGMHRDKFNPWANKGNFNHEVGHIFGLGHAWRNDGCDDTPVHKNDCFAKSTKGTKCDSLWSNNMMDYNTTQDALSPCQIGRVHSKMSQRNSRARRYIKKTWCKYDPLKTIVIRDSIIWSGEKDLSGDLVIESNGFLEIQCRLSIPPGGQILVKKGGTLVLNDSWLHNDCGKSWKGIKVESSKKKTGIVRYLGKPKIENTGVEFSFEKLKENVEQKG